MFANELRERLSNAKSLEEVKGLLKNFPGVDASTVYKVFKTTTPKKRKARSQ